MEFNQAVSANSGENGAVAYLHEKDGNYVSNYMDTLMVYMVQYGTGDLGVVMDEKHKRLLKNVFDEMNRFEDQNVTTTIQAGQSLGNVVTPAVSAVGSGQEARPLPVPCRKRTIPLRWMPPPLLYRWEPGSSWEGKSTW